MISKNISFTIDPDIYEKFNVALAHSGETSDEAADACFRWYIAQAFGNVSKEYIPRATRVWIWDEAEETRMKDMNSFYIEEA